MSHSLAELWLHAVLRCALLTSAAVLLVGALRKPVRHAVGAQAAYILWLAVPLCALVALLPDSALPQTAIVQSITDSQVWSGITARIRQGTTIPAGDYAAWWLGLWAVGCALATAGAIWRQHRYIRSLGDLKPDRHGVCYSDAVTGPVLVGAWRPRLVMPSDAEVRYSTDERELMLAHERAHLDRKDTVVNTFALGALCLSWFNPLMYWAVGRLRHDQEMACDATVLGQSPLRRRSYANALVKTHLASASPQRLFIGTHWQPTHPLTERIAMLKHAAPSPRRRRCGIAIASTLASLIGLTAWAAQGNVAARAAGTPIAIHLSWSVTAPETASHSKQRTVVYRWVGDFVAKVGSSFVSWMPDTAAKEYLLTCNAEIPVADPATATRTSPHEGPAEHIVLIRCKLAAHGRTVLTPSMTTNENQMFNVEGKNVEGQGDDPLLVNGTADQSVDFRMAMLVSTDPLQVAAAAASQRKERRNIIN